MGIRNRKVTKVAAKILQAGYNVFSPITHSHYIAKIGKLPALDHEFWLNLDKWYVDRCDEVFVYDQYGWENSIGVNREMDWAWWSGKKVSLIHADGVPYVTFRSRTEMNEWKEMTTWF